MHHLFKGPPLGYWSPSTSVQGHIIIHSDSEAHEKVYHLQSVSISFAPCYPHNPLLGRMGVGHLAVTSEQS